jgi:uncharacterized protein YcbK (DUF882 family)
MQIKRRDLLLAAGLTLVFGTSASARILVEGGDALPLAPSAPRRLSLRHAHTGETFTGPFRDALGPLPDAMIDLSWFLRDFHEDVRGPLFVETLDFLADVIQESGRPSATILSAYRTKKTNEMLATRIYGVAEKSQHIAGRAIDITLDARLETAAGAARKMSRGGVGWYPRSHFIHLDTGPVRHWTIDASEGDRKAAAKSGRSVIPGGDINLTPAQLKRPLTVQERLRLQRARAKKQYRGN